MSRGSAFDLLGRPRVNEELSDEIKRVKGDLELAQGQVAKLSSEKEEIEKKFKEAEEAAKAADEKVAKAEEAAKAADEKVAKAEEAAKAAEEKAKAAEEKAKVAGPSVDAELRNQNELLMLKLSSAEAELKSLAGVSMTRGAELLLPASVVFEGLEALLSGQDAALLHLAQVKKVVAGNKKIRCAF